MTWRTSWILVALVVGCSGSSDGGTENVLGELVECDEVLVEELGEDSRVAHKVAYVPVADPYSVTITRCGAYYKNNGEQVSFESGLTIISGEPYSLEPLSLLGTDCHVSDDVTFTPGFDVVVECERENTTTHTTDSGVEEDVQQLGFERVYVRVNSEGAASPSENPLGVPVECDEWLVEEPGSERHRMVRRKVAHVPVADPTSVTITRCGEYVVWRGVTNPPRTDCVASREVKFTSDFHVVVECEEETTLPVGYFGVDADGNPVVQDPVVQVVGHEQVYIRIDPDDANRPTENPFGVLVECNEELEWQADGGPTERQTGAYVPVADPTSVTITRCGKYGVRTQSDGCVSSSRVAFTPDFDMYVECERGTTGYQSIYYRTD